MKKHNAIVDTSMNLLLVLISALFYVLSFPLWNAGFLAFFALVPLFRAVESARSTTRGMALGIVWGALMSTGLGYWLYPTLTEHFNVWPPKAVLFFLLCVVLPSCLIYGGLILVYRFVHHAHPIWYALVLPSFWTLGEYLKEMIPVLLPWGAIGYAVLPFQRFSQVADVAGVHGLTFLVVMINATLYCIVNSACRPAAVSGSSGTLLQACSESPENHLHKRSVLSVSCFRQVYGNNRPGALAVPLLLFVAATCLPLVYGTLRLNWIDAEINRKKAVHPPVRAILVQGNFSLHERWSGMGFYHRLQTYMEMSAEKTGQTGRYTGEEAAGTTTKADLTHTPRSLARVIVWPETTLNEPARLDDNLFRQIMNMIGEDALLISGGLKQDDTPGRPGREMNSAYLISGKGLLSRYDKNILLPYAETTMMVDWLGRYYTAPSEFAAGRTPSCQDTPIGRVGISICFEILYPRYISRSVASGADFLVNMSNDGWFGDSAMPHMHLNAARMRAIENRRFLLRAANNGISALISPDGRIVSRTDLFLRQRIEGDFVHLDIATPYTRYGDWLVFFSALVLGMALLRMIFDKD